MHLRPCRLQRILTWQIPLFIPTPPPSFPGVRNEMVPSCWNPTRGRSVQPWKRLLRQRCSSSASEFPKQERGLSTPPQYGGADQVLVTAGWRAERDTPPTGPSILSRAADGAGGKGTGVSPHFSAGILWLLPVVRSSVRAAGSSQGYWVLMTYFLFGYLGFCL